MTLPKIIMKFSLKKGLNIFSDMVVQNNVKSYAINDTKLINFGKNTFFKRAKSRKGYGLFS